MHRDITMGGEAPRQLYLITDYIPGKRAQDCDEIDLLDAREYFKNRKDLNLARDVSFKCYRYTKHRLWKGEEPSNLDSYLPLPYTSLHEYLKTYFDQEDAYILAFSDGRGTVGVHGYKDGQIFVMDPCDLSGNYLNSRTEEQLDDMGVESELRIDVKSCGPNYKPLIFGPIENFDNKNYCILECKKTKK